ncbi:hypothetical protein ACLK1S_00085 [Escherichia coli]
MVLANRGATSGWYHDFLETRFAPGWFTRNQQNMLLWINDTLMADFSCSRSGS